MASPDLRAYVPLQLDEREAQAIFDAAVADLATKLPDLVLREASTEAVVLEAAAQAVAEASYRLNRLPLVAVEGLIGLYGIARSTGAPASGSVTFALSDSLGHEIPANTRLRLPLGSGSMDFRTSAAVVAPPGQSSVTAPITALINSDAPNGTTTPTKLFVVDAVAFIESATLAGPIANGLGPESREAWVARATQRFSRLTSTLVRASDFTAAALEDPRVFRAITVDNHNGVSSAPGHVAVALLGPSGLALSSEVKSGITATLAAQAHSGLGIHVVDPTLTAVSVTAAVKAMAGANDATVKTAAEAALAAYLSPLQWSWAGVVRRFELVSLLDRVPGVDYVMSVTTPGSDVALSGIAPLATPGTLSVTVS